MGHCRNKGPDASYQRQSRDLIRDSHEMLELKPKPIEIREKQQPRRLFLALVLLLVALAGVVVKDRQFWFGTEQSTLDADEPVATQTMAKSVPTPANSGPRATSCTSGTFLAIAYGSVDRSATTPTSFNGDTWSMDQTRAIQNTQLNFGN